MRSRNNVEEKKKYGAHVTRRHGAGGGGSARVRVVVAGSRARAYRPGRSIARSAQRTTLTNREARGFILIKFRYLFVRVCSFPYPPPRCISPSSPSIFIRYLRFAGRRRRRDRRMRIESVVPRESRTRFFFPPPPPNAFACRSSGTHDSTPNPPAHVSSCTRTQYII